MTGSSKTSKANLSNQNLLGRPTEAKLKLPSAKLRVGSVGDALVYLNCKRRRSAEIGCLLGCDGAGHREALQQNTSTLHGYTGYTCNTAMQRFRVPLSSVLLRPTASYCTTSKRPVSLDSQTIGRFFNGKTTSGFRNLGIGISGSAG